jgi:tetraacyldisaccharide 4'-kinase
LRESIARLSTVDFVVMHGAAGAAEFAMQLEFGSVYNLHASSKVCELAAFRGDAVHAVAGIGYPERFFRQLRAAGLQLIEHPFPDHYAYSARDLKFDDDRPVLMTEKDAVKCRSFAAAQWWAVAAQARVDARLATLVIEKLKKVRGHG